MALTKFYLIRHGESQANAVHQFIGQTDLDLTERGHAQAEATAEFLKGIPVDAIYASDLLRAYHTAVHTAEKKGMGIVKNTALREIYAGLWETRMFDDLPRLFPESFGIWRENIGLARCDEGESVLELQQRVAAEVTRLAELHPGQTVFLFTHATPIRALAALWSGLSPEEMKNLPWASNASVTAAECENGVFRLLEYGRNDFQEALTAALPKTV